MNSNTSKQKMANLLQENRPYITKNLNTNEIKCNCGCGYGNKSSDFSKSTAKAFEKIRDKVSNFVGEDTPITINSGCRCTNWNKKIGGAKNSRHIYGDALDISCPDKITYDDFFEICDNIIAKSGGVGYYPNKNFVHIDTRGYHVRWLLD